MDASPRPRITGPLPRGAHTSELVAPAAGRNPAVTPGLATDGAKGLRQSSACAARPPVSRPLFFFLLLCVLFCFFFSFFFSFGVLSLLVSSFLLFLPGFSFFLVPSMGLSFVSHLFFFSSASSPFFFLFSFSLSNEGDMPPIAAEVIPVWTDTATRPPRRVFLPPVSPLLCFFSLSSGPPTSFLMPRPTPDGAGGERNCRGRLEKVWSLARVTKNLPSDDEGPATKTGSTMCSGQAQFLRGPITSFDVDDLSDDPRSARTIE